MSRGRETSLTQGCLAPLQPGSERLLHRSSAPKRTLAGVNEPWLAKLASTLPRHSGLVERLRDAVLADDQLRWFDVSCSLGSGRADELSDIDCAIGYAGHLGVEKV